MAGQCKPCACPLRVGAPFEECVDEGGRCRLCECEWWDLFGWKPEADGRKGGQLTCECVR